MSSHFVKHDYFKHPTYDNFCRLCDGLLAVHSATPDQLEYFARLIGSNREAFRDMLTDLCKYRAAMEDVAARSYPHQLGNAKIVLFERACDVGNGQTGEARLRLHIYPRKKLTSWETRHSHQFDVGSCILTGLARHSPYRLTEYRPIEGSLAPATETDFPLPGRPEEPATAYQVYSDVLDPVTGELVGYKREYVGNARLQTMPVQFRGPGESWQMRLPEVHRFSTVAEYYTARTDNTFRPKVTSTFFVQGPRRDDAKGRTTSMAFIDGEIPEKNRLFSVAQAYSPRVFEALIRNYTATLSAEIEHEKFVQDNNLGTGELVDALLTADFQTNHPLLARLRNLETVPDLEHQITAIKERLAVLSERPEKLREEAQDEYSYFVHKLHRQLAKKNPSVLPEEHALEAEFQKYAQALHDRYGAPSFRNGV